MDQKYKSIKCYISSIEKIEWIQKYMKGLGYHLNKSQTMDAALTQFTKMLVKMKNGEYETRQ